MIRRLAVIGLGLLGGSVAKAARAERLAAEIVAVGRRRATMEPALRDGVVDAVATDVAEGLAGVDFCVLATPVATAPSLLAQVWRVASHDVVITDVGSTKAAIVDAAETLYGSRPLAFVGSHPMAGSEKSGYAAARADLFKGARVVVTPTDATDAEARKRVTEFWEAVGARVIALEPLSHDRAVAAISHLPHLVAEALVDAVVRLDPRFFELAATGFRDTTRIAAGSPQVWREIFLDNRHALGEALGAFRHALEDLERLIGAGDAGALETELDRIKRVREQLS